MKLIIERIKASCETEVTVKCSYNADERTKKLIHQLEFYVNLAVGYQKGEAHQISLHEVYYIESVDEKTFFYLEKEIFETHQKLYEWEKKLSDTSFVRISKSTILNTDKLKCVRSLLNGKLEATMKNGEKLMINRHYVPDFRKKFGI